MGNQECRNEFSNRCKIGQYSQGNNMWFFEILSSSTREKWIAEQSLFVSLWTWISCITQFYQNCKIAQTDKHNERHRPLQNQIFPRNLSYNSQHSIEMTLSNLFVHFKTFHYIFWHVPFFLIPKSYFLLSFCTLSFPLTSSASFSGEIIHNSMAMKHATGSTGFAWDFLMFGW